MAQLLIKVEDRIAKAKNSIVICGNTNYTIKFSFDSEWDDIVTKTLRVKWNSKYEEVSFTGNTVTMPQVDNCDFCEIGVYSENLQTTTGAIFPCRKSILCGFPVHQAPTTDVYNQLIALINAGITVDITEQVDELEEWVEEQTTPQRITIDVTEENETFTLAALPATNKEYLYNGTGTVDSITFTTLFADTVDTNYYTLFVIKTSGAASCLSELIVNDDIKFLNDELEIADAEYVHCLIYHDGVNICCIGGSY